MISEKDFLKEKELLLNSIEQNTKEHWKNYYKDVPIECIYDDLVIDINEIKRLQNNWNELKNRTQKKIEQLEYYNEQLKTSPYTPQIETLKLTLKDMQELENRKV